MFSSTLNRKKKAITRIFFFIYRQQPWGKRADLLRSGHLVRLCPPGQPLRDPVALHEGGAQRQLQQGLPGTEAAVLRVRGRSHLLRAAVPVPPRARLARRSCSPKGRGKKKSLIYYDTSSLLKRKKSNICVDEDLDYMNMKTTDFPCSPILCKFWTSFYFSTCFVYFWVELELWDQRCFIQVRSVSLQWVSAGEIITWGNFTVFESWGWKLSQTLRMKLQSDLLDQPFTINLKNQYFLKEEVKIHSLRPGQTRQKIISSVCVHSPWLSKTVHWRWSSTSKRIYHHVHNCRPRGRYTCRRTTGATCGTRRRSTAAGAS